MCLSLAVLGISKATMVVLHCIGHNVLYYIGHNALYCRPQCPALYWPQCPVLSATIFCIVLATMPCVVGHNALHYIGHNILHYIGHNALYGRPHTSALYRPQCPALSSQYSIVFISSVDIDYTATCIAALNSMFLLLKESSSEPSVGLSEQSCRPLLAQLHIVGFHLLEIFKSQSWQILRLENM